MNAHESVTVTAVTPSTSPQKFTVTRPAPELTASERATVERFGIHEEDQK